MSRFGLRQRLELPRSSNLHETTVLKPFLWLKQCQCSRLYGLPVNPASFALLNERIPVVVVAVLAVFTNVRSSGSGW